MQKYEFRFCALAVPDDWVPVPPLGLAEPRPGEDRLSLAVAEHWSPEPVAAAHHARKQKELLAGALEDFELVREQPWPDLRSGSALTFEYENEERLTSREMRVWRVQGLQLVSLTLSGPGGFNRGRDQVFEAIARSFEPRGGEAFAQAERTPLLADLEKAERPRSDPGAMRQRFPRVAISIAVPRGWDAVAEESQAVLRRSGFELRARRVLEHANDAGLWFERKIKQLRDGEGNLVMAWSQGTLLEGRPYAAVAYDDTARSRTWTTAVVQHTLSAAVADQQLIEWTIRYPSLSFGDAQAILQSVIASAEFLNTPEWETCPVEPWIDLTLKGHWEVEGPGTYVNSDGSFMLLQLTSQESRAALETLRPRLLEGLRQATGVRGGNENESSGSFLGLNTLRWSGQGKMAVRGIWLRSKDELYSCILQGTNADRTEALFLEVVKRLRIPGTR